MCFETTIVKAVTVFELNLIQTKPIEKAILQF
jgi:hypothetical protein